MRWKKPKESRLEKIAKCLLYERDYKRKKDGVSYCRIRDDNGSRELCPYQDVGLLGEVFHRYKVSIKGKWYNRCCR